MASRWRSLRWRCGLVSLARNYVYFHDDVNRSAAAILTVASINLATLGLALATAGMTLTVLSLPSDGRE